MEDLEPSVPRTPTQAVLRMVSPAHGWHRSARSCRWAARARAGRARRRGPLGVRHLWRHDPRGGGPARPHGRPRPRRVQQLGAGGAVPVPVLPRGSRGAGGHRVGLGHGHVHPVQPHRPHHDDRLRADLLAPGRQGQGGARQGRLRRDVSAFAPPARAASALRARHPEGRAHARRGLRVWRGARRLRGGRARRSSPASRSR